jgi:hypothetical protein
VLKELNLCKVYTQFQSIASDFLLVLQMVALQPYVLHLLQRESALLVLLLELECMYFFQLVLRPLLGLLGLLEQVLLSSVPSYLHKQSQVI